MIGILGIGRHRRLRTLLSAYIDGQVSPREATDVERHVATCDTCRLDLQSLRATVGLLRELPELEAPRSFALDAAPMFVRAPRSYVGAMSVATAVAAVLLVGLLVADAFDAVTQQAAFSAAAERPQAALVAEPLLEAAKAQGLTALERGQVEKEVVKEVAVEKEVVVTKEVEARPVVEALAAPAAPSPPTPAAVPPALPIPAAAPSAADATGEGAASPLPPVSQEKTEAITGAEEESRPEVSTPVRVVAEPAQEPRARRPDETKTPRGAGEGLRLSLRQLEVAAAAALALFLVATVWLALRGRARRLP